MAQTQSKGMVYIFTGDGKGKTSAALGVGLRASLIGKKVAMVQWYKDPSWKISEFTIPKKISNFNLYPMGQGFFLKDKKTAPLSTGQIVVDKAGRDDHHRAAADALAKAESLLDQVDVLILDEINNALSDKLIDLTRVIGLIQRRKQTHLVITGRNAPQELIDIADLVSTIVKTKHPYDVGKPAIRGLDF
jgi:cob(I)alamin adenosyltransferase